MPRPPGADLLVRWLDPAIPDRLALRIPDAGSDDAWEPLEVQLGAPCGARAFGAASAGMKMRGAHSCGAASVLGWSGEVRAQPMGLRRASSQKQPPANVATS